LKLVIFDFDGTLVDSRPLILESHRIVFSEFRLPAPSPAHSLSLVGKSLDVILAELAGPTAPILEMVKAYDLLLPTLRADPVFAERPFDGIDALLHELSRTTDIVMGSRPGTDPTPLRLPCRRCDGLSTFGPFRRQTRRLRSHIPRCFFRRLLPPGWRRKTQFSSVIPPSICKWQKRLG
jgi:hypothetical protein